VTIETLREKTPESGLEFLDWGRIAYREAWARQKELVELRIANKIPDTLIFCEHDPVITLGRGSQREGEKPFLALQPGVDVVEIERGGQATYHGPGQIVAYPIFKLDRRQGPLARRGILNLIRSMESWVVDYLASQGLRAGPVESKTGVWIGGERKIASIGIAVRHWVSYHGLALNLSTGPSPWRMINPCGFDASVMTDLTRETGREYSYPDVLKALRDRATKDFCLSPASDLASAAV
jgi:lipoyl(octanoyl) transferase